VEFGKGQNCARGVIAFDREVHAPTVFARRCLCKRRDILKDLLRRFARSVNVRALFRAQPLLQLVETTQ
jgi:hypothetical protein